MQARYVVGAGVAGAVGAWVASIASAGAVPVEHTNPVYVGVSAVARAGDAGLGTLDADCDAAFPYARVCRDEDVLRSFPAPVPGVDARLLATETHRTVTTSAITPYGLSVYTHTADGGVNCSAPAIGRTAELFSSTFGDGVVLTADGGLAVSACGTAVVTACCRP